MRENLVWLTSQKHKPQTRRWGGPHLLPRADAPALPLWCSQYFQNVHALRLRTLILVLGKAFSMGFEHRVNCTSSQYSTIELYPKRQAWTKERLVPLTYSSRYSGDRSRSVLKLKDHLGNIMKPCHNNIKPANNKVKGNLGLQLSSSALFQAIPRTSGPSAFGSHITHYVEADLTYLRESI